MNRAPAVSTASLFGSAILVLLGACRSSAPPSQRASDDSATAPPATTVYQSEAGVQPGIAAKTPQRKQSLPPVSLERVASMLPHPRGIVWVDGKLVVVARGRHRNYGGPAQDVMDHEATLYEIDPAVREPFEPGKPGTDATISNMRVLAEPDPSVVHVFDRSRPPRDNWLMSRPFCTLAYDAASKNLVFCGYSGVDLAGAEGTPTFRKNATDALYRYDLRSKKWGIVEMHRHDAVPREKQTAVISNEYYPHHDPATNPPPHGLLNGPNGCCVAGKYLYAVGKDNHTLARYDLEPLRRDPSAGPPPGEAVLGQDVDIRIGGETKRIELSGHSAVAAHGGWLYLGTRTSSVIVRFPIRPDGELVKPIVGELVAEMEPYSKESKRSADLWDMVLNDRGELFVSCSRDGVVWRFTPDPKTPFDGHPKRKDSPSPNKPWIDIRKLTGNDKASVSNMTFGPDGSLYFCMAMPEAGRTVPGIVMRASVGDGPPAVPAE